MEDGIYVILNTAKHEYHIVYYNLQDLHGAYLQGILVTLRVL